MTVDGVPDGLTRRALLGAGIGCAGSLALARGQPAAAVARRAATPAIRDGRFVNGVAAGEPGRRSVTLWTRVDGIERTGGLALEIATDEGFSRVVHRQRVRAASWRDFTVLARVESRKLRPGERYHYRFFTRNVTSPVGRFTTLRPRDSREPVRIGVFSCQDWEAGYYAAHSGLADEPDLDLIVCLGDYVYERTFYVGPRRDTLGANGDGEVQTLDEYRAKYRMYKTDPLLQAMHRSAAFLATWDDHEVEDDYAGFPRGEDTAQVRVPFPARRANGYSAWRENMPFRTPLADRNRVYRAVRLGANADLLLLDERQYRDPQPCGNAPLAPCPADNEPGRTMLGAVQKRWLERELRSSQAKWKLIGTPLMLMSLDFPAPGSGFIRDAWDGYGAERRELCELVLRHDIRDVVALTGDIHTFFAGKVTTTGRVGAATAMLEFVCGSITSLGVPETLRLPPLVTDRAQLFNPHLDFAETAHRGYGVVEARPGELRVQFKGPETALRPQSPIRTLGRFRVRGGHRTIEVL